MGIKRIFLNNLGLKIISLLLAVAAWVYIVGELGKASEEERAALERLLPYRMMAKFLPVQVNLVGKPKEGYAVAADQIIIEPGGIMVVGPRSLLGRVYHVTTEPVDISEHIKTFTKDVSLMPLAKGLSIKEKVVAITIPVIKK